MVLHLKKLEFPSPKGALCQVWLKLATGFWRRLFLNFVNVCLLHVFRHYLPLEEGGALHLNKFKSPSPKDAFCQVWLKLAQWFWRRRRNCQTFTTRPATMTTMQTEVIIWVILVPKLSEFWLIDKIVFYAVSAIFWLFNGGNYLSFIGS